MLQPPHQRIYRCAVSGLCRVLCQPLSEGNIERCATRPSNQPRLIDECFVRA